MSRRRNRIHARVPPANENVTMTAGNRVLTESVFRDTGLYEFLEGLKRSQGNSVAAETVALVANSVEMTGLSVNRLDRILDDEHVRQEYRLERSAPRSIYRTVERLGRHSDAIVRYLGDVMKKHYGVGMDTVFMDWTSMYFEAPGNVFVRSGHSREHRPDRPQVTVGLSMDRGSGMPIGLTVNPGNILDLTHFHDTFRQVLPLLPEDATIVFDNGAYTKDNARLIDAHGLGFITRLQLNKSDDTFVRKHKDDWVPLDGDVSYLRIKGSLGRTRYVFHSQKLEDEAMVRYRRRAERDWMQMEELKGALDRGKKPRKKYRISNCFVDTRLSYRFPLVFQDQEEAIGYAARKMVGGREGLFVLLTNQGLSASETLRTYRSRNAVETAFRDLKHGLDWRPARCTSVDAIKGRILVSFLALFCLSMLRFLYPEFRTKTAESVVEELSSFSLTILKEDSEVKRRVFSNFGPIIRRLRGGKPPVPTLKAPGQAALDAFPG